MATSALLKMAMTIGMILLMALVTMPDAYGASLTSTGDEIEGTTELPADTDNPEPTFLERKAEEINSDEESKEKNSNEDEIGEEEEDLGEIGGELYEGVRGTEDGNENSSVNVGTKEIVEGELREGNETREETKVKETEETIIVAGEEAVGKGEEKEDSTNLEISEEEGGREEEEEEKEEEEEEKEEEEEEEEENSSEEEEEEEVQMEKSLEEESDEEHKAEEKRTSEEEGHKYDNAESVGTERKEERRATTDEGGEGTEGHDESKNKTDTWGHRKNQTDIKDHRRNQTDKSYHRRNHTDIKDNRRKQKDIRTYGGNYTAIREHRRNRTDIDAHRWNQTDIRYQGRNFTDINDHRRNFTDISDHRRNLTGINNHRRNLTDLDAQRKKLINLTDRRRNRTEAKEHRRRNEGRNQTQGFLGNENRRGPNPIFIDPDHPLGTIRDSKSVGPNDAFNATDSFDVEEDSEETEGSECEGDSCEDSDVEEEDTADSEDSANVGSTDDDYAEEQSEVDEFAGHDDDFGETYDQQEKDRELTPGYAAHLGRKGPRRNRQVKPWPNALIPYVVVGSDNTKVHVERALQHIENKTCLTFKSRAGEQRYLNIKDHDGGCWTSSLGYPSSNKAVIVGLGNGCRSVGGVIHEVLHAAGLFHEHDRPDRNDFIEINWSNIVREQRHNFRLENRYSLTNISYDYKSVMHYGKRAFALDRSKTTLEPKNPIKGNLGGSRLSPLDVERINAFYRC